MDGYGYDVFVTPVDDALSALAFRNRSLLDRNHSTGAEVLSGIEIKETASLYV